MKLLLLLNGGAAASLLTFFGDRVCIVTPSFGSALVSFGVGTVMSVLLFVTAYLVQLGYGNEGTTCSMQLFHRMA